MFNSLLKAVEIGTRLILVGDADQLPSVGAGDVLRDLIASQRLRVVELNTIFRQAKQSMIVVNAHRINQGYYPILNKIQRFFIYIKKPQARLYLQL